MIEDSKARTSTLEALARSQFAPLSEAEQRLLHAVPIGQIAFCGPSQDDDDPANDPTDASNWTTERGVRAELIRWLCVDHDVARTIDPRGLRVHASRIVGKVDLSYVIIGFPLGFERCVFNTGIDLKYLKVAALNLSGSQVQSVNAEGAIVAGDIFLGSGFRARGEVRLLGAQVGGDLACSGGTFENPTGKALSADRIRVIGDISLTDGFSARGEVRLLVAQVGGTLDCGGGSFQNPGGLALNADSVEVKGSVFLKDGFSSVGGVLFVGARIGTNLDCGRGIFKNPSAMALTLDHAQVAGSIFLRNGFSAEGEVWLLGSQVGSNLDCEKGKFKNSGGRALTAAGIGVKGSVLLRNGFSADGEIVLTDAQIGGYLSLDGGTIRNPGRTALHGDRLKVDGSLFLRDSFSAEGEVRLIGAQVGANLEARRGAVKNLGAQALTASGITVKGGLFLRQEFYAEGEVRLVGATIGGNLECDESTFRNRENATLVAENAVVQGHVFLRNGFSAQGGTSLFGAHIGGSLDCGGGQFSSLDLRTLNAKGFFRWSNVQNAASTRLDLRHASTGPIEDEETSWPDVGNLSLDGFAYSGISGGPRDAKTRLEWLDRVEQFTLQPYQQLAKVLRESGDVRGAREVLFGMEDRRRRKEQDRRWYWRGWDWILKCTIGYGQRSEWALLWLLGLTLLGCLFFGCGYLGGAMAPNEKDAYQAFEQQGEPTPYYPRFNALIYSFEHSFPLINLGVREHWLPTPGKDATVPQMQWALFRAMRDATFWDYYLFRLSTPRILRWWLWFQTVAGWVLATLFVAGLTGIVKSGS